MQKGISAASSKVAAAAGQALQQRRVIDKLAGDTLGRTGVPSASIAIVKDGQIIYVKEAPVIDLVGRGAPVG